MKRSNAGSQKKATVENLVGLGPERLAEILVGVAETRMDLKRRLRIELAAEQAPAALTAETDKRLSSFETSRGKITWRQRPAFLRDLDALRELIADRLGRLDGWTARPPWSGSGASWTRGGKSALVFASVKVKMQTVFERGPSRSAAC